MRYIVPVQPLLEGGIVKGIDLVRRHQGQLTQHFEGLITMGLLDPQPVKDHVGVHVAVIHLGQSLELTGWKPENRVVHTRGHEAHPVFHLQLFENLLEPVFQNRG